MYRTIFTVTINKRTRTKSIVRVHVIHLINFIQGYDPLRNEIDLG